jgi:hypothetical protein
VQRWCVAADGAMGRECVVLDGIGAGAIHHSGRLRFGTDGHLYVVTGDVGQGRLAQDPARSTARSCGCPCSSTAHRRTARRSTRSGTRTRKDSTGSPAATGWSSLTTAPAGSTGSYVVAALRGQSLRCLSFTGDRVTGEDVLLDATHARFAPSSKALTERCTSRPATVTDGRGRPQPTTASRASSRPRRISTSRATASPRLWRPGATRCRRDVTVTVQRGRCYSSISIR